MEVNDQVKEFYNKILKKAETANWRSHTSQTSTGEQTEYRTCIFGTLEVRLTEDALKVYDSTSEAEPFRFPGTFDLKPLIVEAKRVRLPFHLQKFLKDSGPVPAVRRRKMEDYLRDLPKVLKDLLEDRKVCGDDSGYVAVSDLRKAYNGTAKVTNDAVVALVNHGVFFTQKRGRQTYVRLVDAA